MPGIADGLLSMQKWGIGPHELLGSGIAATASDEFNY
jgi:hypothetical protein